MFFSIPGGNLKQSSLFLLNICKETACLECRQDPLDSRVSVAAFHSISSTAPDFFEDKRENLANVDNNSTAGAWGSLLARTLSSGTHPEIFQP